MTEIKKSDFGTLRTGEKIVKYTLKNSSGMCVGILNYACAVQSIVVPDKNGTPVDTVLGYDTAEGYEDDDCFLGLFVGRYANRIKGAAFELNGKTYTLPKNDGNNHLHGTFAHRTYPAEVQGDTVVFHGVSEDGEEGFPGKLTFDVSYRLTEQNELVIRYLAATDSDTVVNFTNHSYFNLNGQDGSTVLEHTLQLCADTFTEGNAETIPTGNILPVDGTPMDFRKAKKLGAELHTDYEQTKLCKGYDHNFILDCDGSVKEIAVLQSAQTGIRMVCATNQPGVQIYSGNFLDGVRGKNGVAYPDHGGVCLETQHYPCSPNFPQFPTTVLKPGETYDYTTVYQFLTDV